ncbi:hypothetical protein ACSBR1_015590 [Camellia fascicularis]
MGLLMPLGILTIRMSNREECRFTILSTSKSHLTLAFIFINCFFNFFLIYNKLYIYIYIY